ncbi:MAG: exosortase/archaeosortase family protein [Planctomycetes bacterium]|nr:exosortase/archaeosortase family protein [Planctomycetota bacterium]
MSQTNHPFESASGFDDGQPLSPEANKTAWTVFAGLVLFLTAAYWNMLTFTSSFWDNPLYSHGWIVPVFAAVLLWMRSGQHFSIESTEVRISLAIVGGCVLLVVLAAQEVFSMPSWLVLLVVLLLVGVYFYNIRRAQLYQVSDRERWLGVAILTVSLVVRLGASYVDMNPIDRLSYIGAILGVCQIVGGISMLRWVGPPLGFLVFMFPLPSRVEEVVLVKLQTVAAIASTWTLQLLGVPALREGNRIMIDQLPLEVADACSGLRMGTIFGAMAVAMAMIIARPWWDRLTVLVSALPIALATNVIRITATALLYMAFPENEMVKYAVHEWAGFAMMPIALGFLWLELQLLTRITVPIETDDYAAFGAAHG